MSAIRKRGKGNIRCHRETTFVEPFDTPDDTGSDSPDALEISVAGAMARQHAEDSRSFLQSVAALLSSVLPEETQIERAGLWGGDKRPVRRIETAFAASGTNLTRYTLEDTGHGHIEATRTQIVRGIALKNETIEPAVWIEAVSRAIVQRAEQSKATRDALQRLL